MADILSQDEVDLLLSAVSEGDTDDDGQEGAAFDQPVLSTYDFRRPERVSKDQLKGLQSLFEAFARELSIVLPPFLRTIVRVDLTSIDQLTYDEFILSVARPTSLSIIDMTPLDGKTVLEMSPAMVFPIVDRVLGGKGMSLATPRELTEIEDRIIHRIARMILDCWKRSWSHLIEFKMTVENQESDPLIVQIVAGSEMVVLVGYEIYIGETVGSMNMCVPLLVLNPILDQISHQDHFQRKLSPAAQAITRAVIERTVNRARVSIDAVLGETELELSELARLQVGDVIQLDKNASDSLSVSVGGVRKFTARAGRRGDQSAIQIVSLIEEE